MQFLKVTAQQCNVQGNVQGATPRTKLSLNADLVGAIQGGVEVLPKGGEILHLGKKYFTDFRLVTESHPDL